MDKEEDKGDGLSNGFYWFTSERASCPSICQYLDGGWYPINEHGPITLDELYRRGWDLGKRVEYNDE